VIAVQINLDTEGLDYNKWGGPQHAKQGDWLINNDGECYTIDNESFQLTYKNIGKGLYVKTGNIWAAKACADGFIETKEGRSYFKEGDMILYNNSDRTDGYCMSAEKFEKMYVRDTEPHNPIGQTQHFHMPANTEDLK